MSAQQLLNDLLGCLPLRVYGRGAVLTLLREMGFAVKNKTPLTVLDIFQRPPFFLGVKIFHCQ